MNDAELLLADKAIKNQINLLRFTSGERRKVFDLLMQMQAELKAKLLNGLSDYGKARVRVVLDQCVAIIEATYKEMAPVTGFREPWQMSKIEYREARKFPSISEVLDSAGDIPKGYYLRFDPLPYSPGDILPPSRRWLEGEPTKFAYKGTCVLNPRSKLTEVDRMAAYEGNVYLVKGEVIRKGADPGEVLLKDAKVVRRLDSVSDAMYAEEIKKAIAAGKTISPGGGSVSADLHDLALHEAQTTAKSFAAIGLEASLPTVAMMKALVNGSLIEGSPASAWWSKQAEDLQFKFAAQVRQGIAQNETVMQIVRRIAGSKRLGTVGIMDVSRRNAFALVHTSIQQVANDARLATFRENGDIVKGVRQLSTLDGHTSKICIAYSGACWDLEGKPIMGTKLPFNGGTPRHFNCRSVLVPITKSFRELGVDIDEPPTSTRASDEGQVRADITMTEFLKGKDAAYVDDLLGPGRANLWRDGKITLNQLVDGHGRELTLKELRGL